MESENFELTKKNEIIDKIYKEDKLNMASLSAFTKSTVRLFKFIEEENNVEEIIKSMREIILTKI